MKLLMVTPYFYPKIGGLENYAWNIAKGLKERYNWEIVVVTSNHKNRKLIKERIENIVIYRLPTLFKLSNTPINPNWYSSIKKIVDIEQPNLINGHTPVPFITDIASVVSKNKNIPFVLTYHNDLIKNNLLLNQIIKGYYTFLGARTAKNSNRIVATSSFYVTQSKYLSTFKNKVEVISPGVDLPFFKKIKKKPLPKINSKADKKILFVGQLDRTHKHKGLEILFNAFGELCRTLDNIKLIVVGNGDMINDYKLQVKKLNIKDKVFFNEKVSDESLVNFYKNVDVVVLPSTGKSEGFGMVLIEANACKVPVIGSDIGGIPQVVTHNKNGLLVEPGDVNALKNALRKILTDSKKAHIFGKKGYENVVKNYTWQIQIKKTNTLFKNII